MTVAVGRTRSVVTAHGMDNEVGAPPFIDHPRYSDTRRMTSDGADVVHQRGAGVTPSENLLGLALTWPH